MIEPGLNLNEPWSFKYSIGLKVLSSTCSLSLITLVSRVYTKDKVYSAEFFFYFFTFVLLT